LSRVRERLSRLRGRLLGRAHRLSSASRVPLRPSLKLWRSRASRRVFSQSRPLAFGLPLRAREKLMARSIRAVFPIIFCWGCLVRRGARGRRRARSRSLEVDPLRAGAHWPFSADTVSRAARARDHSALVKREKAC
jgi:hypothetical protein